MFLANKLINTVKSIYVVIFPPFFWLRTYRFRLKVQIFITSSRQVGIRLELSAL